MNDKMQFKKTTELQLAGVSEGTGYLLGVFKEKNGLAKGLSVLQKLDIATAISQGTQISVVRRADPELFVVVMTAMLMPINTKLNLARPIKSEHIADIAAEIVRDFWHLKFEEIYYVIRKGVAGHYNPEGFFSEIDGSKILNWFFLYDTQERESYLVREASKYKKKVDPFKELDIDENYIEMLKAGLNGSKVQEEKKKRLLEEKRKSDYEDYMEKLKLMLPDFSASELAELLVNYRLQKVEEHSVLVEGQLAGRLGELSVEELQHLIGITQYVKGGFCDLVKKELNSRV